MFIVCTNHLHVVHSAHESAVSSSLEMCNVFFLLCLYTNYSDWTSYVPPIQVYDAKPFFDVEYVTGDLVYY